MRDKKIVVDNTPQFLFFEAMILGLLLIWRILLFFILNMGLMKVVLIELLKKIAKN